MRPRFVGVDSAYRNTGIVVLNSAGEVIGREHLKNKEINDPQGFASWLVTALGVINSGDVVALEGLSFGSIGRGHVLAGTYAVWQMAAISCCRVLYVVPPLRVKLWATNNSKAKKKEMIAWAATRLNQTYNTKWSEHEADALALAEIAFCSYYRTRGLPTPALNEKQESILSNKKGDGITQAENKFFFKGPKFDG